jgi:tetratricopeptide (TPR) repeat protein
MNFEQWAPFYRARLFMLLNLHERAIEGLEKALAANPRFGRAASCLGYAHAMLGRDDLAVRYFEQATQTDASNPATFFDLGFVLDRQGEKERAIAAFERAVALRPTLDRAWYGMGLAHAVLGRHDKAAEALERAGELQPMNPYAWYNLGMAYAALGERKKVKEAHAHLDRFDPKMARKLAVDAGLEEPA